VQSFLDVWDGVVHGLERGLMPAADAAESFDAVSVLKGDRLAASRLLTRCFSAISALQVGHQDAET
jgi:hypothetical protein